AAIPQPGPAPAPGPADPPPDPAADARLGPFQDVAGYEVRPPLGYALVPPPATARAGQTPTGWAGQRRADGTIPSLTMLVVHAPLPEVAGRSAEEFLTSMLDGIKRRRSGWQQSAAEPVTVNGLPMFRVTWSGTDTATGRAMRGFVYAGKHDGRFVQVAGQDLDPGHEADLALVEAAARTLRKK
ncbi:MAG: hypothetical protein K2X82_04120, partial [Gemmataceae bacterium]|nr:hypothetical protein [Gemmataceae bacterium]